MAICGYNALMGSGLREFAEGLVLSIALKTNKQKTTLTSQLVSERDEIELMKRYLLDRFTRSEMEADTNVSISGFLGIVLIAEALLPFTQDINSEEEFRTSILRNTQELVDILQEFEALFEEDGKHVAIIDRIKHAYRGIFEKSV